MTINNSALDSEMDDDCPNCGGEGVLHDCIDSCCEDAESGCDLCTYRCDWCTRVHTSKCNWTPGPWGAAMNTRGYFRICSRDGDVLCERPEWAHRASESRANGMLMASAPDLYEALFALLNLKFATEYEVASGEPPIIKDGVSDRIIAQSRAALARARGE